jgi:hypothetical protein
MAFKYKVRDEKQIKERATRKSGKFDSIFKNGFDNYRTQTGTNVYRYLPPTWDGADHYGYTVHVHRQIGADNSTYLCPRKMLNKPCPICEAAKEAKDAGEADEAKALGTSERIISWVLDREGDDPEKPLLYDQSWTQDRDITSLCVDDRKGGILMIDHPDNGYDVSFKRQGTGLKTKYFGYAIDREESPIHESQKAQDEILLFVEENPVPDVLNFYDYNYLKAALSGIVAAKDEDLDGEEPPFEVDDKPVSSSRRRVSHPADPEDNEEEVVPSRRAAPAARPTGRTRVIEEVASEDEDPPVTQSRRASARR